MGIQVNDGFTVASPRAVELRSGKLTDGKSVPYANVAEALAAIPSTRRYVGLAVNVGGVVYTFKTGILDANLVIYDGRPYKSYMAVLSQTTTGAPTAVVVENTLGAAVVWTRSSIGAYVGTLAGAFGAGKVFIPVMHHALNIADRSALVVNPDTNTIGVLCRKISDGAFADWGQADVLPIHVIVLY